jgi:hypothetical protein
MVHVAGSRPGVSFVGLSGEKLSTGKKFIKVKGSFAGSSVVKMYGEILFYFIFFFTVHIL